MNHAKLVSDRSDELIKELFEHFDEYKKTSGEKEPSQRVVFEGWMIQRIAEIQVALELFRKGKI